MDFLQLQSQIEALWENRDELSPRSGADAHRIVEQVISHLDAGHLRVAEKSPQTGQWRVSSWLKQAILLSFRLSSNKIMAQESDAIVQSTNGFGGAWDKVALKTARWREAEFQEAGFRMVPGAIVRRGAFIGRDAVLMPSFVNIGAHVGRATMVDSWATVGSCAQIGANVHLSGGVGIGGVLEPLQANPVIIEDNVFVGARSEVVEGVIVREGAVLSMGVFIGMGTKIVNRITGEIHMGEVPAYSVVVPGSLPDPKGGPSLYCAVIVKTVDAQTRAKTAINALLRD